MLMQLIIGAIGIISMALFGYLIFILFRSDENE